MSCTEFQMLSWLALYFSDIQLKNERGCAACGAKPTTSRMMHAPFDGEPLCETCGDTPPSVITKAIRRHRQQDPVAVFKRAMERLRPCQQPTPPQCVRQ